MVVPLTTSDLNLVQRKGYKFDGLLGEGAYAKVYSVICIKPERTHIRLACKFINQAVAPPQFVKKFLPRELNILLKIKHPNIIHVHSICINNNKCFIFMRLAEAGDALSYLIKMGHLQERHAKLWFHQLAQAVLYLHLMGIVHRDIKLENIFISLNMNVKLGDFGFARYIVNEFGENEQSETFCGSQQYAAPEVIKGVPYNPKLSDVWSLGCVLFAMVNKKLPFDNVDTAKLYEMQNTHRYKYRDSVLRVLSAELKSLVFHMLEPNIHMRYDMEAVVKSDWLRGMPLTEAQSYALETVKSEKSKSRKSGVDLTVSTLQKANGKHLLVLKEESIEQFVSRLYLTNSYLMDNEKHTTSSRKKISSLIEKKEERIIHGSRQPTKPFMFDTKK